MKNSKKNYFAETNRRFGFSADEGTFDPDLYDGRPLVFSADPVAADITPCLIQVSNVEAMKELVGNSNSSDDSSVAYPPKYRDEYDRLLQVANSRRDLALSLNGEAKEKIMQAARAFVYGNSDKVEGYEQLINALIFPTTVAYYSTPKNVTLTKQMKVTGPGPVVLNFKDITFKSGGQIWADVEFTLVCNSMNKVNS